MLLDSKVSKQIMSTCNNDYYVQRQDSYAAINISPEEATKTEKNST